jgi:hypothetical protein
MAKDL